MMRTFTIAIVAFVMAAGVANADDRKRALEAFEEAKVAYEKGDLKLSIEKLREAHGLFPDPRIRISLARRLVEADEPEQALTELQGVTDRKLRKVVKAEIAKIQDMLAQPVTLLVETSPPGALVQLGTSEARPSPLRVTLPRGQVRVAIQMSGHLPVESEVLLKGTKPIQRLFVLEPIDATLEVALDGTVPLGKGQPWAKLDDKPIRVGTSLSVEPGRHEISCGYDGAVGPTVLRIKVPAGKAATVRCALPAALPEPLDWRVPTGWASIGSGAAAIAAGVAIFVTYAADKDQYAEPMYTHEGSSKPAVGGVVTGLGAGLVGLGTYFLLSR